MKRLIDEETEPGTAESRLAELVRAASKFQPAPFRRQRVLARIIRPQPRARRIFRASMATLFALATAAAAAAAIQRPWTKQEPSVAAPLVTATVQPPRATISRSSWSAGPQAVDEAATMAPAVPDAPRYALAAHNAGPRPASKGAATVDARSASRSRAHGEDDPARVLEAIRTLRNGGDATRAAALLDDYLRAHPNGVLSEDALALSIEAADARHDHRVAAEYADRYLRQFPSGRFRAMATQAVQRAEP